MARQPRVRALSGRLLEKQDQEHRRIARELHNTTGQNLAALLMNLYQLSDRAQGIDSHSRRVLSECLALARSCALEIRDLACTLYPPLLDEAGLVAALRVYAEDYPQRTGASLSLDLPVRFRRLSEELELALFRIAQESLASMCEHFSRPAALLRLKYQLNSVMLEVAAHGRPAQRRRKDDVREASIRERVKWLGGRLAVTSGSDRIILRAVLPLAKTAAARAAR